VSLVAGVGVIRGRGWSQGPPRSGARSGVVTAGASYAPGSGWACSGGGCPAGGPAGVVRGWSAGGLGSAPEGWGGVGRGNVGGLRDPPPVRVPPGVRGPCWRAGPRRLALRRARLAGWRAGQAGRARVGQRERLGVIAWAWLGHLLGAANGGQRGASYARLAVGPETYDARAGWGQRHTLPASTCGHAKGHTETTRRARAGAGFTLNPALAGSGAGRPGWSPVGGLGRPGAGALAGVSRPTCVPPSPLWSSGHGLRRWPGVWGLPATCPARARGTRAASPLGWDRAGWQVDGWRVVQDGHGRIGWSPLDGGRGGSGRARRLVLAGSSLVGLGRHG
jgi:hypothetical protein